MPPAGASEPEAAPALGEPAPATAHSTATDLLEEWWHDDVPGESDVSPAQPAALPAGSSERDVMARIRLRHGFEEDVMRDVRTHADQMLAQEYKRMENDDEVDDSE